MNVKYTLNRIIINIKFLQNLMKMEKCLFGGVNFGYTQVKSSILQPRRKLAFSLSSWKINLPPNFNNGIKCQKATSFGSVWNWFRSCWETRKMIAVTMWALDSAFIQHYFKQWYTKLSFQLFTQMNRLRSVLFGFG